MPFNLGFPELLVVLVVSILVFGGRLPEVARKVASAMGEFKRGMREEFRRMDVATRDDESRPPPDWQPPPDGAECEGLGGGEGDASTRDEAGDADASGKTGTDRD